MLSDLIPFVWNISNEHIYKEHACMRPWIQSLTWPKNKTPQSYVVAHATTWKVEKGVQGHPSKQVSININIHKIYVWNKHKVQISIKKEGSLVAAWHQGRTEARR